MMMTRTMVIGSATILLLAVIAGIVTLTITTGDAHTLIQFVGTSLIPTIASLLALSEANRAKQNTNGLLHAANRRADHAENKLTKSEGGEK